MLWPGDKLAAQVWLIGTEWHGLDMPWSPPVISPWPNHALMGYLRLAFTLLYSRTPWGTLESQFWSDLAGQFQELHWCINSCIGPLVYYINTKRHSILEVGRVFRGHLRIHKIWFLICFLKYMQVTHAGHWAS